MTNTRTTQALPRILAVDDTPDNLFLLQALLEDRFEVLLAASGADALKLAMSGQPPDLVLLDIMMPDMDGYEVLRRLRQYVPTATVPVIFLTARGAPQDQALGRELGAIDYVTKPIDPENLIERVDAHVRHTCRARSIEQLAEKLSGHLEPTPWRRLFSGGGEQALEFEDKVLTVVYAETTATPSASEGARGAFAAEVGRLSARYGGHVDRYVWGANVAWFEDPHAAVHMAMAMDRGALQLHLRVAVHTGRAVVASFPVDGVRRFTLVGDAVPKAAAVAALAATGSIVISPETYAIVQEDVNAEPGYMLMEEFNDHDLAQASIIPTPERGGQDLSTFAGLGTY